MLRQVTMKTQSYKIYEMQQKQISEESSQQSRPSSEKKKGRKIPNKILTYHLKELEKEKKQNLKTAEGIIKIREEVNKTDIFKKLLSC